MIFNPKPTPSIPYGFIDEVIYKWYAGTFWGWRDPNGEPDGTLTVSSRDGGEPYSYVLELTYHSLFNPFGEDRYYLFKNNDDEWIYAEFHSQYYYSNPANPNFVDIVKAAPERIYNASTEAFKVYSHTRHIILSRSTDIEQLLKPQIKDYFFGYSLDAASYKINLDLQLLPSQDGTITIHFYYDEKEVQLDSDGVPHPTVSIQTLLLNLIKDVPYQLKLDCIPCSISLEGDNSLCNQLKAQIQSHNPKALPDYLPILKSYWEGLYNTKKNILLSNPKLITSIDLENNPYVWSATARWGQQGISDRNTGSGVGESINDSFIFNKYFKPQSDGTFGNYIMPDSALVKKIGNALNADKWGINPDDPTKPRKDDLGWRIQRMNEVLGIRVKTDGTIDEPKEKKDNRREHAEGKERKDPQEYNPNCFGSKGMLVRYLPNKFKRRRKHAEILVVTTTLNQY